MYLVYHGGNCCGVKTIKGFCLPPSCDLDALKKLAKEDRDAHGWAVQSDKPFFDEGAPVETAKARFDRYIDFLKRRRPEGLVECYLISSQWCNWDKVLIDHGFEVDKEFKNSNTGNMIRRYSLVMTKEPAAAKEKPLRAAVAGAAPPPIEG